MGRRIGRGGPRFPSEILWRRIESCEDKYSTMGDLVDYLQSNYPDYRQTKQQPFARLVQQTLDSVGKRKSKNPKRAHEAEERLMHLENEHVKRRRRADHDRPSTSSSSSSSSEEEDGVSTLEDAMYGEKVEPEFDLMKSILWDSYSESKATIRKSKEKNIEFEITPRKIDLVNVESREVEMKKEESVKEGMGLGGEELKGKEGPRFRDLGGMESDLEELKMEVIVPLYHPQLPQWLGVRPMAGILLYGPPGCGKTKLAHAIANETGVPFYKISATEVVSDVSGMDLLFLCL